MLDNKQMDIAVLLIENDANVNAVDKDGNTPLHYGNNSYLFES